MARACFSIETLLLPTTETQAFHPAVTEVPAVSSSNCSNAALSLLSFLPCGIFSSLYMQCGVIRSSKRGYKHNTHVQWSNERLALANRKTRQHLWLCDIHGLLIPATKLPPCAPIGILKGTTLRSVDTQWRLRVGGSML